MERRKNQLTIGLFLAYFLCCFIKLSPSAVMPQVQLELNLNASITGLVSSMYFIPYALMQFLSVPLCRRYGAGKVFSMGLFVSALGLAIFGLGNNSFMLACGRFLTGLGTGPFFIGLVFHLQECYSGSRYVKVYGYTIFASNLGSSIASTPLKLLLNLVSWKAVFLAIFLLTVLLSAWIFHLSRFIDKPSVQKSSESGSIVRQILGDFRSTLSKPYFLAALLCWVSQGFMLLSYQGLWCIKWTTIAYPNMENIASFCGLAIGFGLMASGLWGEKIRFVIPQFGARPGRGTAVNVNQWFCAVAVLLTVVTKLLPPTYLSLCLSFLCDVLFGFSGGLMVLQVGVYVREHTTQSENSSVMAVFNCIGAFSQQMSQWITGAAIDAFAIHSAANQSFAYTYLSVAAVIAMIAFCTRRTLAK